MAEAENQSDIVPGTVFTSRQVRILKFVVIAMGVMLVAGFVLVIAVIVYQASSLGDSAEPVQSTVQTAYPAAPGPGLSVPDGMSISHMALDDNRLAVHLTGPRGSEIRIIDLGTGAVVQRIPLKSE